MLPSLLELLHIRGVILASSSPRRQELLQKIGLNVSLMPSQFEENLKLSHFESFEKFVEATALGKVEEVYSRISKKKPEPEIVIGADTIVTLDGEVYGKPKDDEDAFRTLKILSGKPHTVYTGVALKIGKLTKTFTESTKVFIGKLSDEEIKGYIATGEPRDKAGSYGIQGIGGCLVERIEGDFFTVMGLPLYRLNQELTKLVSIAKSNL